MRSTALLLLFALAACASVLLASDGASSSPGDWTVTSTVVLEEESLLMEGNITVAEGGLLEVRGTAITFNCSYPGQYVLAVQRGGGLVVTTSATGRGASIRPADPSAPTVVRVERAETLRLDSLLVEACGYWNPDGINEFYPAISITDVDGPVVRRCTFTDCFRSLYLSTCANAILEDNTIEDSEGYGINVYGLTASRVEGNSVSGTSSGIECYFSDGLRLSKNVVRAPYGCIVVWGCDEAVVDGGRLLPEGGTALYVDRSKLVRVSGVDINGSLDTSGGSHGLVLYYASTATVNGCSFEDLGCGVRVVNSEKFSPPYHFLSDNRFSSCRSGAVLASSNNTLVRNRFSDCLLGVMVTDEIHPLQPQIRAGASGNELFSCTFEDCRLAIELINATGTMIEGCSFWGGVADLVATASTRTREVDGLHTSWEGTAVGVDGGDYGAENVSLLGGPTGLRLEGGASGSVEQSRLDMLSTSVSLTDGSVLDLVNTSHPRRYDVDGTSKLRVWWDVEVETGYESGDTHNVPGTLDIGDSEGVRVGSHYCMPSGLPVPVVVLELELEGVVEHNWTPHSFTVTTSERGCSATVGIFRFTRVLLLLDDVAPTIEVEAPVAGALNRSSVWFNGRAVDGVHGPAAFVVRIDGADAFSGCGTWAREVGLEDGPHAVTYVATDGSGNVATLRSELLVDTTPPDLVVTEPGSNETLTSAISIRVAGRVTGHRSLLID
ncbi:MAG: right-handed parallel beta-helix repeat-containing protein, partial [Thermoplasmata archaeon]|nr:right-handed parallel beta-helix repeat-containing protein [Thermoplasmata archaeon]